MQAERILFEDNHLVIINKLPGEIVQGDKTGDLPLSERVKDYLKKKYHKPGNVFTGVIHRLDRPVSGIVVFAKTSKALARMNELFQKKEFEKVYWAITGIKPSSAEGKLAGFLRKNELKNKSYVDSDPSKGGKHSELHYKMLGVSDNYFLLEVNPVTGRHHQIRALLSHAGMPIKGDLKYGFARSNKDGSICLHAHEVRFTHPVKNELVHIICPPPDEPLWNYFAGIINHEGKS
jgi:23S rRNA pseudouridine1911/1915/1917 synthase